MKHGHLEMNDSRRKIVWLLAILLFSNFESYADPEQKFERQVEDFMLMRQYPSDVSRLEREMIDSAREMIKVDSGAAEDVFRILTEAYDGAQPYNVVAEVPLRIIEQVFLDPRTFNDTLHTIWVMNKVVPFLAEIASNPETHFIGWNPAFRILADQPLGNGLLGREQFSKIALSAYRRAKGEPEIQDVIASLSTSALSTTEILGPAHSRMFRERNKLVDERADKGEVVKAPPTFKYAGPGKRSRVR